MLSAVFLPSESLQLRFMLQISRVAVKFTTFCTFQGLPTDYEYFPSSTMHLPNLLLKAPRHKLLAILWQGVP